MAFFLPASNPVLLTDCCASTLRRITCFSLYILWLFINPFIVVIFNFSYSSWLDFLHHWPVLVSITGPHILHRIVFLNVFSLHCVTLVVAHSSQLYASVGLIIDVYNLTFVRFEKSFDLRKKTRIRHTHMYKVKTIFTGNRTRGY